MARRRKSGIEDRRRGGGQVDVTPEKDDAREEGVDFPAEERQEIMDVDASVSRMLRGMSSVESRPRYMVVSEYRVIDA